VIDAFRGSEDQCEEGTHGAELGMRRGERAGSTERSGERWGDRQRARKGERRRLDAYPGSAAFARHWQFRCVLEVAGDDGVGRPVRSDLRLQGAAQFSRAIGLAAGSGAVTRVGPAAWFTWCRQMHQASMTRSASTPRGTRTDFARGDDELLRATSVVIHDALAARTRASSTGRTTTERQGTRSSGWATRP